MFLHNIRKTASFLLLTIAFLGSFSISYALTLEFDPPDKSIINFGAMNPGDWTELQTSSGYWHALVVKNSVALPWQVSVKCDGLLRNGAITIPSEKFLWMSAYAGSKNAPYDNYSDGLIAISYRQFYETGQTFFNSANSTKLSSAGHITTPNGAEIQLKYLIAIPPDQLAGDYSSTITFTVTQ